MKTRQLIMVLMAMMLICNAHAKIGEPREECSKIYGMVTEDAPNGGMAVFRKGGIFTTCFFVDGVCEAVNYQLIRPSKVVFAELGKEQRFTPDQVAMLLNLNRSGSNWVQASKLSFSKAGDGIYRTADGKLQALVNSVGLTVETVRYNVARKSELDSSKISQVIASFGSDAVTAPKPASGEFPPTAAEQEQIDLDKRLEDSRKKMEESLQKAQKAVDGLK